MSVKSGYFEIGTIIYSDGNTVEEMSKTVDSLLEQTPISRKIIIASANRKSPVPKKFICDYDKKCKELGKTNPQRKVMEFKYVDITEKDQSKGDIIYYVTKEFIDKSMPITIHLNGEDKKSRIKLSHFLVIDAGKTLNKDCFENTEYEYLTGNRSISILPENVDEGAAIFHRHGFLFFVQKKSELGYMEQLKKIEEERIRVAKEKGIEKEVLDNCSVFYKMNGFKVE